MNNEWEINRLEKENEQLRKDNELLCRLLEEKRSELGDAVQRLFDVANENQKLRSIYKKYNKPESWFDRFSEWLSGRWGQ